MPSSLTTPKITQAVLLVASSWINIVSANINFAAIPANLILKPGDFYEVKWTVSTPTNAAQANMNSFTLQLRAVTQQRYDLQTNIAQTNSSARIQIPSNATGGGHKFYADYQGNSTGPSTAISGMFNITGDIVPMTPTGSTTDSGAKPTGSGAPAADTGMSGGALAGIIGGVVILLLGVAMMFYFRHRRRVAQRVSDSRSMDESKEGFGAYSKNQDKESLTRSAGSGGGPGSIGGGASLAGAAAGGPRPRPDERSPSQQQQGMNINPMAGGAAGGPRPRLDERSPNQQDMNANAMTNNRYDGSGGGNSPTTRNPFEGGASSPRLEQYQPPPITPQPPRPYQQQSPFANPPMQHQPPRNQSPYQQPPGNRDSFQSEIESAYDPTHRANPMLNRNDSNPNGARSSPLSHSASGSRYPHNTTPQPTQQNPFASQDREMMAVAAAVAAAASPVQGNRQLDSRSQSPVIRSATPRAIEMQPLDIQQHHLEQQQRMAQRQQQQQTQAQPSPKPQTPVQPLPAAQQSINPTQFDDKAEIIEEDSGPAYNGYRDTIFGAYAQNQDDDEEEEEAPVPMVPNHLANTQNNQSNEASAPTGGAEIQRKKSVKFTGVPASGPIVLPNHEAVKEHQIQKSKQQQQQQQPQQQARPVSEQIYSDDDYDDEDDNEIQMRMIEQELAAASPVPTGTRPYVNTTGSNTSGSSPYVSALSPVRSPNESQGNINDDTMFGNDFYEDVIAAVDKSNGPPESPTSPVGLAYKKPPMPPPPASAPAPPQSPPPSQQQQFVQQQHIPIPQPQHMAQEVFGAPSPRIAPASLPSQNNSGSRPPRANARPSPPPGAPRQQHHSSDEEAEFYASSLM